jgi:hypothetical protein
MNFDGKFMQDLRIEFGLQLNFLFIMGMGMSHKCNQYPRLLLGFLKMQQIVIIVLIMLMLEVILMG